MYPDPDNAYQVDVRKRLSGMNVFCAPDQDYGDHRNEQGFLFVHQRKYKKKNRYNPRTETLSIPVIPAKTQ